jgi:hypothetical protein
LLAVVGGAGGWGAPAGAARIAAWIGAVGMGWADIWTERMACCE